ncbi:extracellular solute-binding protein [Paenibacillus sp. PL91]|uniref:extracellular solute-binding protein n=1 Tax=Paenibacillus sp. PL91 TaxID=2729538 RepID=UPI00145D71E5|nr:extracellular solute-binding protein [Paenibacillus sp. PL91]MBC9204438.1 extracellular solute-binding protein [Paenibacillus sp. PL91]
MTYKKGLNVTISIMLTATMLLAGCAGNNGEKPSNEAAGGDSGTKTVKLKTVLKDASKDFERTDIYKEIVKQTGVTFSIESYDPNKFKVQLAGGDLPDIIQVDSINYKQMIEGNLLLPLDDLVKTNGKDIMTPTFQQGLDFSRKFWSNGTGKLYLIPSGHVGPVGFKQELGVGWATRWDYYKELGFPEINNEDDMLNVLEQMVKKHPTTADGKPVYGVSTWNDWGAWGLTMPMAIPYGYVNMSYWGVIPSVSGELVDNYANPDSPLWKTASFFYKAKQKGILDPDTFTNKSSDFQTKGNNGQILFSPMNGFDNTALSKEGPDKGFVTIPLNFGYVWNGAANSTGWDGRAFAISKNSKNPERAMDLINFLNSEKGSRLLSSGIEGIHWDVIDGKPQLKEETLKMSLTGGDAWSKIGIGGSNNQQGLSEFQVAKDGGNVNLFDTSEVYASRMNALQKDFSEHYGVSYPSEIMKKRVEEGIIKDQSSFNNAWLSAIAQPDDDMKRLNAQLEDMVIKGIPSVVLNSKNDAEFEAAKQQLIDKLKKAGVEKSFAWWQQAWSDAKAAVGN